MAYLNKLSVISGKSDIGLENVDNTSDANKPVSIATQTELNLKQPKKYRFGFDEYGMFKKPSDFTPTLPCNFYRDSSNVIKHDMDFGALKTGTKIYVNVSSGSDSTGNGTIGTPYKTIQKACTIAAAGADAEYSVVVTSTVPFFRDEQLGAITFTNKNISIVHNVAGTRIVMSMGQRGLTWTQDGTGTWKASRTGVYAVYDFRRKDVNGVYIPLDNKSSLANCQANINSWYTDSTYIWVHTSDGLIPTDTNIAACVQVTTPTVTLLGTSRIYFENIDFCALNFELGGIIIKGDATGSTVVGRVVANGCTFASQGRLTTNYGNAFETQDVKNVQLFNCFGGYAKADVFNYHFTNVPTNNRRDCLVLEYVVEGYNAGLDRTDNNNNATTAHEGANVLRIGCSGSNTKGPVLADVGGCYSICIDCDMVDSTYSLGTYYFEANVAGKAILINCSTDEDAIGLNANCKTYAYNFIGNISNTGYPIVMD